MRIAFVFLALMITGVVGWAQAPRVRADGEASGDLRGRPAKTLNDHFPFVVPDNAGQWYQRSAMLRRRVLVATGLWPMPEKPPLNAVVYGKTERDGFTVEKVFFESLPGHFVTGLLFRPTDSSGDRLAGVLCPHGHGGRMQRLSDADLDSQIAQGAEHFRESGRTPKLARCAQLARMGCVTFIFDMLGYADSIQIPFEIAHRHQDPRPEESQPNEAGWLFFSPDADLRLQSIMGLQTWNAIRSLDFLASLPDVDADRLAVTGGSGGGTQSILLGAIDDRIEVSFPNGMVSTSMQGGCYCENCNLLRVDTGNVELAALFAPKPQAMTAADDWTRDMMNDGYPELKWLYAMIGNETDVYCRPMLHFKHNYNYVTRATMYQWMNRHLKLGLDDPVIEQNFVPLTESETSVWSDEHPRPDQVGMEHERAVCRWFDEQSQQLLFSELPSDEESLKKFRDVLGGAWQILFDQNLPTNSKAEVIGEESIHGMRVTKMLLGDPSRGAEVPLLAVRGGSGPTKTTLIWTLEKGKDAAFDDNGRPTALLTALVDRGLTVLIPDLMGQGEWGSKAGTTGQRLVDDSRSYSAFTYGYNRTLAAERCADLLLVVAHAAKPDSEQPSQPGQVCLLGSDGSAPWAAPAAALAGPMIARAAIVSNGFRFSEVRDYRDPKFVPGAVKYGDLPVLFALRAPHPLMLLGEAGMPDVVTQVYKAAGAIETAKTMGNGDVTDTTIKWLAD